MTASVQPVAPLGGRAEQVDARRDDAEPSVGIARHEEADRDPAALVDPPLHAQGRRIALADDVGNPGGRPPPFEEMQSLDRDERQPRFGGLGILRAEEVGAQHDQVEADQHEGARERQTMLSEPPPDQPPVRGDRHAVLGGRRRRGREHAHLIPLRA
jgi:hypothetical protein